MASTYNTTLTLSDRKKQKQILILPKINKLDQANPQGREVRSHLKPIYSKNLEDNNIFKLEEAKKTKSKLRFQQQKGRQMQRRQMEELQLKVQELIRSHKDEMRTIQQTDKNVQKDIAAAKKDQYTIKLNIWELRNELMELNSLLLEQQNTYNKLEQQIGQQQENNQQDEPHEQEYDQSQPQQQAGYQNNELQVQSFTEFQTQIDQTWNQPEHHLSNTTGARLEEEEAAKMSEP